MERERSSVYDCPVMLSIAYARMMNAALEKTGVEPGAKTASRPPKYSKNSARSQIPTLESQELAFLLLFKPIFPDIDAMSLLLSKGAYHPIPPKCPPRSPKVTVSQSTAKSDPLLRAASRSSGTHLLTGSDQCCSPASMRKSQVVKSVVKSPI